MEHTFLDHLSWRNAEKNFDPDRKVSDEDIDKIVKAIHMAPSSFGLQPYHIYVVSSEDLKAKLREQGFDQAQFTECSHIFVFASRNDVMERIDEYVEIATGGIDEHKEKIKPYADMMRGMVSQRSLEELMNWAHRQTYIALAFGLAACAELEIDSCPMEGFSPEGYNEILGVPQGMTSVVVMTVGYRKEEPKRPKVRFPEDELFTRK